MSPGKGTLFGRSEKIFKKLHELELSSPVVQDDQPKEGGQAVKLKDQWGTRKNFEAMGKLQRISNRLLTVGFAF